jgi:hypothetical protein
MTKKGSGTRDKDADVAVLDEIRELDASLDGAPPFEDTFNWSVLDDKLATLGDLSALNDTFNWSALDDKLASLGDLSALNDTFNWSAFDDKFASLGDLSTLDAMFPTLDKRRPRRKAGSRRVDPVNTEVSPAWPRSRHTG